MAVCMFLGVIFAGPLSSAKTKPGIINKLIGVLVIAAGGWNVFWYSLQHLTEFWGLAALASGILMIIAGLLIVRPETLPEWLRRAKWPALILLLALGVLYAVKIASL